MVDVLCVGNALVDAMLSLRKDHQDIRVDEASRELCLRLGQKIPLESYSLQLGGNACNVSVGLCRLGLVTGLYAQLGSDIFAKKIIQDLTSEQVSTAYLQKADGPTSFAVVLNHHKERTLFVQHVEREHNFSFASVSTKFLYLSSLGREWKKAYKESLLFVQSKKLPLFFNPGTPQLEEGAKGIQDQLTQATILFLNKDEAERLLNTTNSPVSTLLKNLQFLGPKSVVITDGINGSYAIDEKGTISSLGITESEVVERTGAGDAFTTGFIAAYIEEKSFDEAMQWGTLNAASVVGKIGSQPGLLTKDELIKQLPEATFSSAKEAI